MKLRSAKWTPGGVCYVSFYTPNYAQYAFRLIRSLRQHGMEYDVTCIKTLKSWQDAVRYKPQFMLDMVKKHKKSKAIVWIDADAEVRTPLPIFGRLSCLWAMRHREHTKEKGRCVIHEYIANIIYLRTHPKVVRALERWVHATTFIGKRAETPEQTSLANLLHPPEGPPTLGVNVVSLPWNLCKELADSTQEAQVWQYQVSRKHNPQQVDKRRMRARQKAEAAKESQ